MTMSHSTPKAGTFDQPILENRVPRAPHRRLKENNGTPSERDWLDARRCTGSARRTPMQSLQDYRASLQLPADGGKSLNRLYAIVGQAGFNILVHDENGNAAVGIASGGLTPRTLQRVRDHIEAHLAVHIELEALADIAGLSLWHFARAFKQSVGMPPHHYLMRRRLERAQELLTESNLSLAQIAVQTGFDDHSHFSRRYRQFFGVMPNRFRRSKR
jgi:AraC-like DNA-binding protein